jgi:hypothetical protein
LEFGNVLVESFLRSACTIQINTNMSMKTKDNLIHIFFIAIPPADYMSNEMIIFFKISPSSNLFSSGSTVVILILRL